MATQPDTRSEARTPLSRERVLQAAIELADQGGVDAISMRKVGQELGVEAMSLYNHVANKEDLLTGMVDAIVEEIPPFTPGLDWKTALRGRALAARDVFKRHEWAPRVIETRTDMTPPMLAYMDSVVGIFIQGGFSMDLTHHAMHVLGSRAFGFTQELFKETDEFDENDEMAMLLMQQMLEPYPNILAMAMSADHEQERMLGPGCDDDLEFVFGLDLILDGLERLRDRETEGADAAG